MSDDQPPATAESYSAAEARELTQASLKAGVAAERGDYRMAIEIWQPLVERLAERTPLEAWLALAKCYRRAEQFQQADETIKQAQAIFGEHLALLSEWAEVASSQHNWHEAVKRWQVVINSDDKSKLAAAYERSAAAYIKLENFAAAEQTIDQARANFPKEAGIESTYAEIAAAQKNWTEAVKRWQAVVDKFGEQTPADAWAGLLGASTQAKRWPAAEAAGQQALRLHGNNVAVLIAYAEIAAAQKNWDEALRRWQTVLEIGNSQQISLARRLQCRLNLSILRRLINLQPYRSAIAKKPTQRPKLAIYTSLTKGYDQLLPPEIIDKRFDYIAYTDDKLEGYGIFELRPLDQPDFKNDAPRATRYPKMHPHVLLANYDVALWVDSSLMIVGDLMPLVEAFLESGKPIGNGTHHQRTSLSQEFQACIDLGKDDPKVLARQREFYQKAGFETDDLAFNGVLLFNLKHPQLAPVLETWWDQVCRFSRRDQLSFNYALNKNGAERFRLTIPPDDIRDHRDFIFVPHHTQPAIIDDLTRALKK